MRNKFGRLNGVSSLIIGIVSLILGILLILNPSFTLMGLCGMMGAVVLVVGVVQLILYFAKAEFCDHQSSAFAVTLLMILIGVFAMVRREDISNIFPQFLAAAILVSGVLKMQYAMDLFGMRELSWRIHFIIGLVIVLLSGLVLVMPQAEWFQAKDQVPFYLCLLLSADGALSIACLIHVTARRNRYRRLHPEEFVERIEKEDED